jgi:NTP pyrophosphatase (non-canonical NTP hydrolase)
MNFEDIESRVIAWAAARSIIPNSNALTQAIKTTEEVAELLKALNKRDTKEVIDAYGDVLVTLVIGAELYGVNLVACFEAAYDTIKDRKGHLGPDGIFYKHENGSVA